MSRIAVDELERNSCLMLCMDSTGNARSCPFTYSLFVLDMQASVSPAVCVPTMQHSRAPCPPEWASLVGFLLWCGFRVFQLTKFAFQCRDPAHLSIHPAHPSPDLRPSRSVPSIMIILNTEVSRARGGELAVRNPSADSCSALPICGRHGVLI